MNSLELAPGERLVQAWREISWQPGVYSIVKFDLTEQGAVTKIVFDQTGFPGAPANTCWLDGRQTTGIR
jgi:Activator of Hsp90 ATPase homolog 1-like protein